MKDKEIFKAYISEPCFRENISINRSIETISKKYAESDLTVLRYLMENRYCGWEYYENKGIEWNKCFENIHNYISQEREIPISEFCRVIHKAFNIGIVDNHLSFCSPLTGRLSFSKQFTAYFADFKVERIDNTYYAVESNCENVADGDIIDAGDNLYPTLSSTSNNKYLVGIRSFIPMSEMMVIINGKSTAVSLHRCRANHRTEFRDVCLKHSVKNGTDILRSNCCDYVGGLSEKTDYEGMGKQFRDKDLLILNYLSNEGGYNRITREFIKGLNDYSHCSEYSITLISPVTEGRSCERKWVTISEAEPYDYSKATFDGKLIMLVNSDTASSGESAVLYARSCRNMILIGENTMGCNTFGNVAGYELPNSHIICRIPNTVNLCEDPEECVEGYGFTPDYWVDSDDVEGEVLRWLIDNSDFK